MCHHLIVWSLLQLIHHYSKFQIISVQKLKRVLSINNNYLIQLRAEIVRVLVTSLFSRFTKPTRAQSAALARKLILKYPFMKDDLGNGYVSHTTRVILKRLLHVCTCNSIISTILLPTLKMYCMYIYCVCITDILGGQNGGTSQKCHQT